MASSLGTLTLDLIARIGGFTGPLDKASAAAKKSSLDIAGSVDGATAALVDLSSAAQFVVSAISGISVGAIFTQFINNTIDAQNEQTQLAAVLKSTGNAAGYTQDQLNAMAGDIVSTFSGGELTTAQTSLLAFTGIVGDQFPRALKAAADMAARTGSTVSQAAETIGRSLDVPSAGLSALSKQGFRFTQAQKDIVDAMESVGDTASAQNIILEALESTYGGAASQAAGTLGGSITNLSNAFNDLLTGDTGISAATAAVSSLTEVLKAPGAKDALEALAKAAAVVGAVLAARLASSAVTVATSFAAATLSTIQYQFALARMAGLSNTAAASMIALGGAARIASAAMALVGGPVGVAILAASAVAYFAFSSDTAEESAGRLADKVDYLNKSFDGFTKNQARAALQDINKDLQDAQLKAIDAESAVAQYSRLLKQFPNDARQREWNESLITAQGELDGARQGVEKLGEQINVLQGIMAKPVEIAASKVYTELSAKIQEQILLADKKTDADKLAARIGAGLVKGLKAGEGELLVAQQKTADAAAAAAKARDTAADKAKSDAKQAADAARALLERGEEAITAYKKQIELLDETTGARAKATEASKVAFDTEQGKLKGISAEQKLRLKDLAAELDAKKALQKVNDENAKLAAFEANLRASNQTVKDSFDLEAAGAGSGDKLKERLKANLAIEQDYQKQREELYKQFKEATLAGDPDAESRYKAETDLLSEALAERIILQQDYYNQQDEMQNDWLSGVSSAWENYRDTAMDYQQQAADFTSGTLNDATSGVATFLDTVIRDTGTAGEAFKAFGMTMLNSVVSALEQMLAQWIVTQTMQLIFGKATQASAGLAMVANAQATAFQASLAAFASTAAIPIVGPLAAPAAAAAAASFAAPLVAGVATSALAGQAHDGIDSVPADGTWNLQKGERVTTSQTSAKLDKTLDDVQKNNAAGAGAKQTVNVIEDASKAGQTRTRLDDDGVTQLTDVFVSQIYGDGPLGEAMQSRFGLRGQGQ